MIREIYNVYYKKITKNRRDRAQHYYRTVEGQDAVDLAKKEILASVGPVEFKIYSVQQLFL